MNDATKSLDRNLCIEVVYALPTRQRLVSLRVEAGCTALEAVHRSGLLAAFPDIDLTHHRIGIWGQVVDAGATTLQEGDRVEIYRSLLIDPKAVRQARAAAARLKRPR